MSDRDYNSPEYDRPNYETAEEYNRARREREAKMAEEGQNPYGNNYNYNNYGNYNTTYQEKTSSTGDSRSHVYEGGTMKDANGNPLKNYFALKVVLSIMMIMGCCCSNFFLVIVGIIALVFTCMANTAYNQGNAEEFQKKSKISSVLLGIGGVVMAFCLLMGIIVFGIANQKFEDTTGMSIWELFEEELGNDFEDLEGILGINPDYEEPEVSYEYLDDRTSPLPDCFQNFSVNGVLGSVPMTYDELIDTGFKLDYFSEDKEIDVGGLEVFNLVWGDYYYGYVCFSNYGEETLKITEAKIDSITFYNDQEASVDLVFFGSVTWASDCEELEKLFGKPQYVYTEEYETMGTYEHYTWSYAKEGIYQDVVASFANGELYEISIEWAEK